MAIETTRHVVRRAVRLDACVAELLQLSRRQAREMLRLGRVCLDGRAVGEAERGLRLEPGRVVEVDADARLLHELRPRPGEPLVVLGEAEGWIALDKPAGLGVHPLRADRQDTLLNRLVVRHPEIVGVGEGGLRSGVVHRLDVDTSGVQLFALDQPTWQRLRAAFSGHRVHKVYRALVEGQLEGDGEVELPLAVVRHRPARVAVVDAGARASRRCSLRWRPLERFDQVTLVEVRPLTGFLHQVRVSLAHIGHPLVGDRVYGPPASAVRAGRHLLHAARVDYQEIAAESPDPPDLAELLGRLRRG